MLSHCLLVSVVSDEKLAGVAGEGWFCCPQEALSAYIHASHTGEEPIIFADNDVQHLKISTVRPSA